MVDDRLSDQLSDQQRKILLIHFGGGIGGAPVSMLQLGSALKDRGFSPKAIFSQDGPILRFAAQLGVPAQVAGLRSAFFYGAQVPLRLRMLVRFVIYESYKRDRIVRSFY